MMLGKKIELLHCLAQGDNAESVRAAITRSMTVGRIFPIVILLIRKPSLSFKPNSQTFIIFQISFPNSVFEPYCQTLNF